MELKNLGRYELRRVLGKGAMGVVYEGFDPTLSRRVAVKTILKSVGFDDETERSYAERFVREAKAVARLNHPNIVQVHDFGVENEIAYLVMEFIQGRELRAFFDAGEKFDAAESVRIMGELLDALEFAHEAGVIHRDIKPANVMLDAQRRVKLADFGVARLQDSAERSLAGTMVGTPAFMSPEQIKGGKIDRRTDIFSAGNILYQLLTGEQPFKGEGAWTVAKRIVEDDPPAPSSVVASVSPAFDAVVDRALAKLPAQRFASAGEFASALRAAHTNAQQTVPAAPKPRAMVDAKASETELEFWRSIQNRDDLDELELYVDQFPNGAYTRLARLKIAKLREPLESARKAVGDKAKQDAEEQANREAEARAQREAEEAAARKEAEKQGRREAEERAKREAEARARREAEEKAIRDALEKTKREAAEKARRDAAEKARRDAEEKARRDAEEKAKREAAEKAKREAEEQARRVQALARLKQQEEAAARAKAAALDEDATVAIGKAAKVSESPAEGKRSFVIPAVAGVVIVLAGVAAYLISSRTSPPPAPAAQAPAPAKAEPPAPAKPEAPAIDVEKMRREAEERVRREYADKSAAEQAAAAKVAAEKALKEKQLAVKAAAEKTAAEKAAAAKSAQERASMEKALAEKAAAEKAAAAKSAAEKAAAEKAATEKAAAESAAAERAAAEKVAAEKAATAKAPPVSVAATAPAAAPREGVLPGRYVFRLRGCGANINEDIEIRAGSSQSISGKDFSDLRFRSAPDGSITGSLWDNSRREGVGDVKLAAGRATAIGLAGTYEWRSRTSYFACRGQWTLWRRGS